MRPAQASRASSKAGHEAGPVEAHACFDAKGPRIRLVKTSLPNFSLPKGKADAAVDDAKAAAAGALGDAKAKADAEKAKGKRDRRVRYNRFPEADQPVIERMAAEAAGAEA